MKKEIEIWQQLVDDIGMVLPLYWLHGLMKKYELKLRDNGPGSSTGPESGAALTEHRQGTSA